MVLAQSFSPLVKEGELESSLAIYLVLASPIGSIVMRYAVEYADLQFLILFRLISSEPAMMDAIDLDHRLVEWLPASYQFLAFLRI